MFREAYRDYSRITEKIKHNPGKDQVQLLLYSLSLLLSNLYLNYHYHHYVIIIIIIITFIISFLYSSTDNYLQHNHHHTFS